MLRICDRLAARALMTALGKVLRLMQTPWQDCPTCRETFPAPCSECMDRELVEAASLPDESHF